MERVKQSPALLGRSIVITSFVSALAAGMSGCGSSGFSFSNSRTDHTQAEQARMATVDIDPNGAIGDVTQDFYRAEGRSMRLPTRWVSEATGNTAEIEARRAAAQSAFVQADANRNEQVASADADLVRAVSDHESATAYAERMRETYQARANESYENIRAAEMAGVADHQRREELLSASVREWQSEVERMRSEAETDWERALAEHESMLAQRAAVSDRGRATIEQMQQTAELTENRASERVRELRNAAKNIAEQTDAKVEEINSRVSTVRTQTQASVAELMKKAETGLEQSRAKVDEMIAEAKALESQDVEERYRLSVMSARVKHEKSLTDAGQLKAEAQARSKTDRAEEDRRRAEADRELEFSRTVFAETTESIEAGFERELAAASVTRAEGQRIERSARAKFVQAEIDARVASIREQASHDIQLSKDEKKQIQRQAEAEAARAEAQLKAALAARFLNGATDLPGNDVQNPRVATPSDAKPTLTRANGKPETVEPRRIAAFRSALAEASRLFQQAEAEESQALANRDEKFAEINAWLDTKGAEHEAWHAAIDAWKRQADSATNEMVAHAEGLISAAHAERQRAEVDAESNKQATLARIEALRSGAEAERQKGGASYDQLVAQAESTRRSGESEAQSLIVQRDAAMRRGTAQSNQCLAEAQSLEQSQQAVVAQMRREIESSEQILAAELDRLDQTAETFVAIASANFDESSALANTFERITVANTAELAAAHFASKRQNDADIGYARTLAQTDLEVGDANVTRIMADAMAELGANQAIDVARRGTIEANRVIANAGATEQYQVAGADERAVLARFNHRMVQTESERNRAYADVYLAGAQQQANATKAVADANAHGELANTALARLNAAANSFQRTAHKNWDSRLAHPAALPSVADSNTLYNTGNVSYPNSKFDLYEFDNDASWVVVPTDE